MITDLTLPQSSGKPSVQDNMWCIAYSDNSGAIDMKYVFDVDRKSTRLNSSH